MQAHHRRSLWPGAQTASMLPGFVPDETTTIGEAPLTKPKVWFDARANKAKITYPPAVGPSPRRRRSARTRSSTLSSTPNRPPDVPALSEMTPIKKL